MTIKIAGYDVLIDDEDADEVLQHRWYLVSKHKDHDIYFNTMYKERGYQRTIELHRFIMKCSCRDGKIIDHISGDTLDNRKSNLRCCTHMENLHNARMARRNTSGYKGILYIKSSGKWETKVRYDNDRYYGGSYNTPEEAAKAYDKLALAFHKEFAYTNFPKENYSPEDIMSLYNWAISVHDKKKSSKYRGVSIVPDGAYVASICYKGNKFRLGTFKTQEDAARAYDRKAIELGVDKARLNFPSEEYKEATNAD